MKLEITIGSNRKDLCIGADIRYESKYIKQQTEMEFFVC